MTSELLSRQLLLLQFFQCFFDASHGFDDVLVAGGVAHPEAFRVAEGIAADSGHMGFVEQVEGKVGAVADGGSLSTVLAIEAAALREEVEGTLRYVDFQSRYLFGQFDDEVASAFEGQPHVFHALLVEGLGGQCRALAQGARSAGILSLQFVASFDNPFRCGDVSDAPARHGIGLADAVDDDGTFFHAWELGDAFMVPYVVDMFIDFVGQHIEVFMAEDDVGESLQFLLAID